MTNYFKFLLPILAMLIFGCDEQSRLTDEGKRLIGEHKIISIGCDSATNTSNNVNCKVFYKNSLGETTFLWENAHNNQITWLTIKSDKMRMIISDSVDYPTIKFCWNTKWTYPDNIVYIVWKSPRQYAPF